MTRSLVRASAIGVSVALLWASCWACATGRVVLPTVNGISYERLNHVWGFSYCHDGRVGSFISVAVSGLNEAATRAHEAKHVEQYARYPSCAAFYDWFNTPRGMIEIEAEAYATGICVLARASADTAARHRSDVNNIVALTGSEINRPEIERAYNSYSKCGKEP